MNLLFIGTIIFTCIIQAFTLGLAGNPHQQVILENTIPTIYFEHPEVLSLTKQYRKALVQLGFLFSGLSLSLLFTSYESIQLTIFWFLLFISMAGMYLCEIAFIRKMKALITKNQWQPRIEPKLVDTTLILNKNKKMVPVYWLYLSFLFSLPLSWYTFKASDFSMSMILFASSTFLFLTMLLMYHYISRIPARSFTSDPESNQKYNDLTKHSWSFLMILTNWLMLPLLYLPVLMMENSGSLALIGTILFVASLLFFIFFIIAYLYALRKKQDAILMEQTEYRYNGDDEYWRYAVYINPNDPKLFVPDRIGMNLGMNLGRPAGKIMMLIVVLLLIVTTFFTLVPAYLYDFTGNPLQLEANKETVTLSAPLMKKQTIQREDIERMELIDELPSPSSKTFGTATKNYAIGRFNVNKKAAYFLIYRHSSPILKIQTKNVDYYYTNKIPEETLLLYENLLKIP